MNVCQPSLVSVYNILQKKYRNVVSHRGKNDCEIPKIPVFIFLIIQITRILSSQVRAVYVEK